MVKISVEPVALEFNFKTSALAAKVRDDSTLSTLQSQIGTNWMRSIWFERSATVDIATLQTRSTIPMLPFR